MEPRQLRDVLARNLREAMAANPDFGTQQQIEARSGVGQTTISRILKSEGATTLDVIARLATAIGLQPWELLVDQKATREAAIRRMLGAPDEPAAPAAQKKSA